MQYQIDGKKLPSWAKAAIAPDKIKTNHASLAGFYCNLVYTFIENNYVGGGRIETQKTRYAIRQYLAQKRNPTKLSGGLCNAYIADLVNCGLASMDGDRVVLMVPENLINKGQVKSVTTAIRVVYTYGWTNLSEETLKTNSISIDDVVEACFAIAQLLPADTAATKENIRTRVAKTLQENKE